MEIDFLLKNSESKDHIINRRKGKDRRKIYDLDYFKNGGIERRTGDDRRDEGHK